VKTEPPPDAADALPRATVPAPPSDFAVYTTEQLAAWLGISTRAFERLVAEGSFSDPDIRLSRKFVRWSHQAALDGIQRMREVSATRT
jgi:hypothetical protein